VCRSVFLNDAPIGFAGIPGHDAGVCGVGGLVERIGKNGDLQDQSCPPDVNRVGRALARPHPQITNWHRARVSNAATESANNLIKRIKRVAFGFRKFAYCQVRALLYAGRPNWEYAAARRRISFSCSSVLIRFFAARNSAASAAVDPGR
jgi:hypothetical protein